MVSIIKTGDRVAYSAKFLKSIACYTGEMPYLRGIVIDIVEHTPDFVLVSVKWDGIKELRNINIKNLARVGTAAMSAN